MRVVVSGAGGYIGIPLCNELAKRGHDVWAFDRFFFGKKPDVVYQYADTRTHVGWPDGGFVDAVIDLAGLSNDASADIDPQLTADVNLRGATRLADLAKALGVKKYIYSSSCSVYGHGNKTGLTETDECYPLTAYAKSKVGAEDHLRSIASTDFDPIILRNATVFGVAPRMRFDLAVNIMTLRAWRDSLIYVMGGGEQLRPFVHVLDVVRAFVLALERKEYTNNTFNVGGDSMNMTIENLASQVRMIFPQAKIHHIPDELDKRSYHVSFKKFSEAFDFKPYHGIINGICEVRQALIDGKISGDDPTAYTVQWYRSLMDWDKRLSEVRLDGRIL